MSGLSSGYAWPSFRLQIYLYVLLTVTCLHMQHHRQTRLQSKLISKHVSAALASHQDVPTSNSNGAGGGKPRVMVIGEPDGPYHA